MPANPDLPINDPQTDAHERKVVEALAPDIAEACALLLRCRTLAWDTVNAMQPSMMASAACQVQTQLLARLYRDLYACLGLAQRAYVTQLWSLGASAFEVAMCIGHIGTDDALANQWLSHKKATRTPWKVRPMIRGLVASTSKLDPGLVSDDKALSAALYEQYSQLCMPKHANPVIERGHMVAHAEAEGMRQVFFDVRADRLTVAQVSLGIAYTARPVAQALWLFARLNTNSVELGHRALAIVASSCALVATCSRIGRV